MSACLRCKVEISGEPPGCACPEGPALDAGGESFARTLVRGSSVVGAPAAMPAPIALTPEAPADDLAPGTRVGEYEVERKLGEGAFGSVFSAMQPVIGKRVAVKLLHREVAAVPEMVARFTAEARAVNQIRHRNIVDIFSFGTLPDGRHYYVMEYLEGDTLADHLAKRGKLDLAEVVPILRDVAKALAAAHAKGIAHRDLKPENVLLAQDTDGTLFPKLLDFGIAKLMKEDAGNAPKTRTGTAMGTASYMSPEQCRGKDIDQRTDVYAFGVMTYELLTGKRPFDGESFVEVAYKHIHESAQAPSVLRPELPLAVDAAVHAMMQKDPDRRPPDIARAMASLQAALGVPGTGTSGPFPAAAGPAPQGRGLWIGIGAALFLALATFGVVKAWPRAPVLEEIGPPPPAPPVAAKLDVPALPGEPPAAAAPATVVLELKGGPAGAEVLGPGGVVLGKLPGKVTLARGDAPVRLDFRARGHKPASKEFTPAQDGQLTVELAKVKKGPSADDIEEAF